MDSQFRLPKFISESIHPELSHENETAHLNKLRGGEKFPFVIAIIPAYNEQDSIERTLNSLRNQTRRPDEIIVVADNCTDDTISLALAAGVSVMESRNNADGKAGALNGLLNEILPILDDEDAIMVMDADTCLSETFIESTVNTLFGQSKKPIAGVGGIFLADDIAPLNFVEQLQSNEYVRYQRRLSRRRGRALVLTGTGTVFKVGVLRQVQHARITGRLPDFGKAQSVYDISALTEDNELTICVKELGYRVVSPKDCTVKTAMMPSLLSLYKQRRRWQRGALENIIAHRINLNTLPYLLRQILTYIGVLFLPFYIYTLTVALLKESDINFFQPLWLAVMAMYIFEQTFSVRKGGRKAIVVSLMVVPEILMNMFLDVIYTVTLFGALFATDEAWGRMRHLSPDEFNKFGIPLSPKTGMNKSLHGTHKLRQTFAARSIELALLILTLIPICFIVVIPLIHLQLAWDLIASFVFLGFLATIGRLIPVKTF